MPSDPVTDAIAAFRAASNDDEEAKVDAIASLEDVVDPRVVPFFLETLADPDTLDLARIEICEVLKLRSGMTRAERAAAAKTLSLVLLDDEDTEVRNYAAMALSSFLDFPEARSALERVLLDTAEHRNVRHNAVFAVERAGPSVENRKLLLKLEIDPELARTSRRILGEWDPGAPEDDDE